MSIIDKEQNYVNYIRMDNNNSVWVHANGRYMCIMHPYRGMSFSTSNPPFGYHSFTPIPTELFYEAMKYLKEVYQDE